MPGQSATWRGAQASYWQRSPAVCPFQPEACCRFSAPSPSRIGPLYDRTVLSSRQGQSSSAGVCETYSMGRRSIFLALFLTTAAVAAGQNAGSPTHPSGPRSFTRSEGRQILAFLFKVSSESDTQSDCSHLVHDVYRQAGFPYEYASSRELYAGSANFTRVRAPQAGDLVVWQGHVGIVIEPRDHSFFSFVRSGPDTQFYDSPY